MGQRSSYRSSYQVSLTGDDVCYMYYTSGSTGKPKGVVVEHRNVVNQLYHFQKHFKLQKGNTVMAVTTLTFDPCICEIYWPLAFGAKIMVASSAVQRRGERMIELLERAQPFILQATPTMYGILTNFGWEGDPRCHALSGGEAFPSSLAPTMQQCRSFSNVYGPTGAPTLIESLQPALQTSERESLSTMN